MTATAESAESVTGSARATQKRLIVTIGNFGGSSKSPVLRILAQMHLADVKRRKKMLLLDGDSTTGSLYRFHGGEGKPAIAFELKGRLDERDRLVNDFLQRGSELVLVDLPAGSLSVFYQISKECDFVDAVTAAGYRLTVVAPIFPDEEVILDLQETIRLFDPSISEPFLDADEAHREPPAAPAPRVDYVAMVNLNAPACEDRSDFEVWDAPAPRGVTRRLLEYVGGVQIEVPRLRGRIQEVIGRNRLTFRGAETSEHLNIMDRGRVHRWNNTVEATMRGVGERLGF
jgi:hypothetical protein